MAEVVITGIGLVTPLGRSPAEVLGRIAAGEVASQPSPLGEALACPLVAPVADFDPQQYFPENKALRLMNRDAELAVVAARLAVQHARIAVGRTYPADEIALFGATGLSGIRLDQIARLVEHAAAADGSLDLDRFGRVALRRIRPVLSFKILANMPMCFVSIFEGVCGPNAVYAPWEGQGAQAIAAGIRAIRRGEVPCALVGGCDVKTHELALVSLQQLGVFDSWVRHGRGTIPGEAAAFLVLEDESRAHQRSARICARIRRYAFRSMAAGWLAAERSEAPAGAAAGEGATARRQASSADVPRRHCFCEGLAHGTLGHAHDERGHGTQHGTRALAGMFFSLTISGRPGVIAAGDGDVAVSQAERAALERSGIEPSSIFYPKAHLGNAFAAAAAIQVALAAELASRGETRTVLANCLGFGTEQGSFVVEAV